MAQVKIWTDGACLGNPGPGGWGALLRHNQNDREISGSEPNSTNNRMELMAAIAALEQLKRPCSVVLTTDSIYLRDGITKWIAQWQRNNWKTASRKPVKNQELWKRLLAAVADHQIEWHWTKGHAGHPENERVDKLARAAATAISRM